ncbi:MAG TPA: hypothetical protein OIM43_09905 [Prevotellaceae bacterium]|nr:hypothetical protein [Prevotellaceae bacterium]
MGHIELKKLFEGLQKQMTAQLSTDREFIIHPGSKGDALENTWIEWLRKYLPNRYCIEKAIVIDSDGNTSDQIDVVIYDNWYTPFIFTQNGFHYIPAEGVYAVFEVKPNISKEYIKYAGNKIASVRQLKRTSTSMINSGKKYPPRQLTEIVGGFLCSTIDTKKLHEDKIEEYLKECRGICSIDIGCIADTAEFFVNYNSLVEYNEINTDNNTDYMDHILNYYKTREMKSVKFSRPENSLVSFSLQLSQYLQQSIGTIAAIDFQAYLDSIGEEIDTEL